MNFPQKLGICLGIFLLGLCQVSGQPENFNWYFGQNAAVNFSSGSPVAVSTSAMSQFEGSASVSDKNGNLIFYSNGISVWDAANTITTNGTGLLGHSSSTQSCAAVPKPGDTSIYYLFTADAQGWTNGLHYSEFDRTLRSGAGDIVSSRKNISLYSPTSEKICVVPHSNCVDYWVITHKHYTDSFYVYLVSSGGVSGPIKSRAGTNHSAGFGLGYLKASPDGTRLASCLWSGIDEWELFDFDNSTGLVSNAITLAFSGFIHNYGCEFSPSGRYFYGSSSNTNRIIQFDLDAGSTALINSSALVIGTTSSTTNGALQLAVDGKIYVCKTFNDRLGVINFPDSGGLACNYVDTGVFLGTSKRPVWGLPNFYQSGITQVEIAWQNNCWGDTTEFRVLGDSAVLDSVVWFFGDSADTAATASGIEAFHVYKSAGWKTLTIIRVDSACTDTSQHRIFIQDSIGVDARADTIICDTSAFTLSIDGSVGTPQPYGASCGAQNLIGSGTASTHTAGSGTSSTTGPTPFYGFSPDQKVQYLYFPTDFAGMDTGVIESVAFYVNSKLSSSPFKNLTISMGCTGASSLTSTGGYEGGLDVVYGPASYSTATGWNTFTLDKTFTWDGISNIVVEICYDNTSSSFFDAVRYTTTGTTTAIWRAGTGAGCSFTTPTSQSNQRANLRVTRKDFPTTRDWIYCWSPGAGMDDSFSATPTIGPSVSAETYYVTIKAGDCEAYDSVVVGRKTCTTLPIELRYFDVERIDRDARCYWETETEINASHFEIEHSLDGINWEKIAQISAAGNSFEKRSYAHVHILPPNGRNYYRLKMVDLDESFSYSEIKWLDFDGEGSITLGPNPLASDEQIVLDLSSMDWKSMDNLEWRLFNAAGQLVIAEALAKSAKHTLSLEGLAKGVYHFQIRSLNGNWSQKIVIQ